MAYLHAHPFWYIEGKKRTASFGGKKNKGLVDRGSSYKDAFTTESEGHSEKENIWSKAKKFFGKGSKRKSTQKKTISE